MEKVKNNSTFLINKQSLGTILSTGLNRSKAEKEPNQDNLYVVANVDEKDESPLVSPSKLNILVLRSKKTKKLTVDSEKVSIALKYLEAGQTIPNFDMEEFPFAKYVQMLRQKDQEKESITPDIAVLNQFKQKIQSRDNHNVGDVALMIATARKENNIELVRAMLEMIKNDPNYAFAFENGKLSFKKLNELATMDKYDVKVGMDRAEELEYETGKTDASELTSEQISEYSAMTENEFQAELDAEVQTIENSIDASNDTPSEIDENSLIAKAVKKATQFGIGAIGVSKIVNNMMGRIGDAKGKVAAKKDIAAQKLAREKDQKEQDRNLFDRDKDPRTNPEKQKEQEELNRQRQAKEAELARLKSISQSIEKGQRISEEDQKFYNDNKQKLKVEKEKTAFGAITGDLRKEIQMKQQAIGKVALERKEQGISAPAREVEEIEGP